MALRALTRQPDVTQLGSQLMSRRYDAPAPSSPATSPSTNGRGFVDDVMAAALIDRLVHHCHIVNICGKSYRMRAHRDLVSRIAGSTPCADPSPRKRRPTRQ